MAQAFGIGNFGVMDEQVRRNMEMFERTFAMFTPFARREAQQDDRRTQAGKPPRGARRDRRSQEANGRDAKAA